MTQEDYVIKGKDNDGDEYIPQYFDNLNQAVARFDRCVKAYPNASEFKLLDNNTGEVLILVERGVLTHKVGHIKEKVPAMRIVNLSHVTLHAEAWAMIEQAKKAGWQEAYIVNEEKRYPDIGFYMSGECYGIVAGTVPGYTDQNIYGYAVIKWNRPILTPTQVQSLKWLLDEAGNTNG